MNEITQPLDKVAAITTDATDLAIRFGPRLAVAIAILAVGWFVGGWLGRATDRMMQRTEVDVAARLLLVRIVRIVVLALFLIMALQNLGVELLPLIAGLGVAGVGITLAMQGVLSNVAAGLTIILTRPFKVGDYISIAGEEGCVEEINLFSTRLSHADLSRVMIPNRKISGEILHNYGQIRQLDLMVGVAYDTDLARALRLIEEVLAGNAALLKDPAPVVQVLRLAESSITIAVRPWVSVQDFGAALGEVNRMVIEALQRDGITLPFPRRDVRILSGVTSA
jgi:small conductance mechanosensitive channel